MVNRTVHVFALLHVLLLVLVHVLLRALLHRRKARKVEEWYVRALGGLVRLSEALYVRAPGRRLEWLDWLAVWPGGLAVWPGWQGTFAVWPGRFVI